MKNKYKSSLSVSLYKLFLEIEKIILKNNQVKRINIVVKNDFKSYVPIILKKKNNKIILN